MTRPAQRNATYEDLCQVPDHLIAQIIRGHTYEDLCQVPDHLIAQIIRGQLITLPRPAPRHARPA